MVKMFAILTVFYDYDYSYGGVFIVASTSACIIDTEAVLVNIIPFGTPR